MAHRAANTALRAVQQQVADCKGNLTELAAEKANLQQSAEEMQSQLADNAQVGTAVLEAGH